MNRLAVVLTVALLPAALVVVGCQDKCKQELAAVSQDYNDLRLKHQALQKELSDSEAERGRLLSQADDQSKRLTATNAEIAGLKAKQTAGPAGEDWQTTATGAKITLAGDILFPAGKATLSQGGAARISQVASTIKATYPGAMVRVYGFTDNDPIKKSAKFWKDNLDLSSNRAMAVTRQLQTLGISAESMETIGMGATHFVSSNATAAGKAKNRRVEIVVVKQP